MNKYCQSTSNSELGYFLLKLYYGLALPNLTINYEILES